MSEVNHARIARGSSALALAIAAILGAASNISHAETAGATTTLEEIVVTAERRTQSLQDLPASATVLTADSLAQQGVKNILDLQQVAPSVAINTYNRGTFINIRGVGIAQSAPTSNPGVAYYVDGVFIPHETFIAQSFYDIDSIEVLRGPQGTLTGQNSTGGAVYARTPAPNFNGFSGYVDYTAADYSWDRAVAAANIPMGDVFALRVAGTYDTHGSFTKNIGSSSSEPGSSTLKSYRATLRIRPTDAMTFDLRYEHFDLESGYNAIKNRHDTVSTDPFVIEEDARSFLNQSGYRTSVEGRFDLTSTLQLRALTSYFHGENYDQADGDRSSLNLGGAAPGNTALLTGRVGYTAQTFDTRVSEINLLSTGDSPFQWVVGGFYMNEGTPVSVLRDNFHVDDFVVSNSSIVAVAHNESSSAFGQIDYKFNDMWALDFGLRYSKDSQDYTRYILPGPPPPGCFPCTTTADSNKTTGRLGAKFFMTQDAMLYATVSRGYKAGGNNLDPRLGFFGPETNDVGELGIKTTMLDKRLRINGDVFYSKYDGIQLSALTSVGPGPLLPNTLNAAGGKIYGAEWEFTGQFGGFGFNAGLSYIHGEFSEDSLLTNSETNTNQVVPEGSTLPFSPKLTLSAGVQYDFLLGSEMMLTPRLQVSHLSEQLATPFPSANTTVPAHTVTDLRVTLAPNKHLRLEAFATNLFDKTYIAVQVQDASSAAGGYLYGAPRQMGLRAVYKFD